jgi:hypothetical protein
MAIKSVGEKYEGVLTNTLKNGNIDYQNMILILY